MIPVVPSHLRGALIKAVRRSSFLPQVVEERLHPEIHPLSPDIELFRLLKAELEGANLHYQAAIFHDEDDQVPPLPVLLAPDPLDLRGSQDSLLSMLEQSDIKTKPVSQSEAESIFVDRASEFLAARLTGQGGGASSSTVVNSNRSGDTILYCKGYFVSTATAFGVSTPATNSIPAGRYSFGILDAGSHRFEGVVWTCPANVRLNLP
jgi:hypothetical protein